MAAHVPVGTDTVIGIITVTVTVTVTVTITIAVTAAATSARVVAGKVFAVQI